MDGSEAPEGHGYFSRPPVKRINCITFLSPWQPAGPPHWPSTCVLRAPQPSWPLAPEPRHQWGTLICAPPPTQPHPQEEKDQLGEQHEWESGSRNGPGHGPLPPLPLNPCHILIGSTWPLSSASRSRGVGPQ